MKRARQASGAKGTSREEQIPRGLKPTRNDKKKACTARLKPCPFKATRVG